MEAFEALVDGAGQGVPLDRAALLISACAQPGLDVDTQLGRLDDVAAQVREASVEGVTSLLFGRLGLRGNTDDYGDPRNSFLDQVLDRRLGIPISLAVLAMEVGRRVGVTLVGVGMPGHFLIGAGPAAYIDAFRGGQRLDIDGCRRLYGTLFGASAPWSPGLLVPTPSRAIVARMLANLTSSYRRRDDTRARAWVARLRAAAAAGVRERLQVAEELRDVGRFDLAALVLDQAAGVEGLEVGSAERLRAEAANTRARLN
jgi:regulator of sirC expression with transglutaminase-like and TPR domain